MPRASSTALTEPGIEKIGKAPPGKQVDRFDRLQPGLALRVTDKGAKSWCVFYRLDGRQRRRTIGSWPAIGVAEARKLAKQDKNWAGAGIDPAAKRAEIAEAERAQAEVDSAETQRGTFGVIAEDYIKRECARLARGAEIERMIRRELLPHWKDRPAAGLRRRDAIERTDALIDAGKPAAAHRLFETIKRIARWAIDRDLIEASPLAVLKPPVAKKPRDRALTHPEIKALWSALGAVEAPFGPMVQMLLLTGQRRTEVAEMTWGEVDLEQKLWTLPAARTKSDRAHLLPLSEAAVAVLRTLMIEKDGELRPRFTPYVFTTTAGKRPVSGFSKAKARIDEKVAKATGGDVEALAAPGWRLHDLRRTVRSEMARLGIAEVVSERVLNHAPRGLAKVYNVHEYADEKRDALDRWAAALRDIVTPPPANVRALRPEQSAA